MKTSTKMARELNAGAVDLSDRGACRVRLMEARFDWIDVLCLLSAAIDRARILRNGAH